MVEIAGRDALRYDPLAQQCELRIQKDTGSAAGDRGGGTMVAHSPCGPNRHRDRGIAE
jgi:hypothetical protein